MSLLFHDIIYGPVKSRRFGYSLGMNLLPTQSKICSFNCIYCECGWNPEKVTGKVVKKEEFFDALEQSLISIVQSGVPLDVLTYAGNGEPTLHPDFLEIAKEVSAIRNRFAKGKKIVLLTNGTTIFKSSVQDSLTYIDMPVFKLDSAIATTQQQLNLPNADFKLSEYITILSKLPQKIALQTMFLKGFYKNSFIDNTTDYEVDALIEAYKRINPLYVLIYSLDRRPPLPSIEKIEAEKIHSIAKKIEKAGVKVQWV